MYYYKNRSGVEIGIPVKNKSGAKAIIAKGQLLTERELKLLVGKVPMKLVPRILKRVEISSAKTQVVLGKRFEMK